MTDLAAYVPSAPAPEVTDPTDPRWHGVIELSPSARDVATLAATLGTPAVAALAGYTATGGPGGLIGCGVVGLLSVIAAHKVAHALRRPVVARPVVADGQRMLPGPAPAPVAVTVEVVAVGAPVSEPFPGVHVEEAARFA